MISANILLIEGPSRLHRYDELNEPSFAVCRLFRDSLQPSVSPEWFLPLINAIETYYRTGIVTVNGVESISLWEIVELKETILRYFSESQSDDLNFLYNQGINTIIKLLDDLHLEG